MILLGCLSVFVLLTAGITLTTGLDDDLAAERRRRRKAKSLRLRSPTAWTRLARAARRQRAAAAEIGMPRAVYWALTAAGAAAGGVVGRLFFSAGPLAALTGALGALAPLLYVRYKLTQVRARRVDRLRSSMMLLSGSYIVTEDFIKSVQDNIDALEYPEPFRDFLTYVSLIDGSVKTGLRRMEARVDNPYFSQWIDALVLSQDDRSLKTVTMSVVDAMNDVHQAQAEADTTMYAVWREYFTVLALIFSVPVIFRVLMPDAYALLVATLPGQALLCLLLTAVAWSLVRAVRINRPVLS